MRRDATTEKAFKERTKSGLNGMESMDHGLRHDLVRTRHPEGMMPRGDKDKYTDKQKRMEDHIEEGYERKGVGKEEAERRAWATVNKQTGGGNKSGGSGRGKKDSSSGSMTHAERSRAAEKGWETRRREGTA